MSDPFRYVSAATKVIKDLARHIWAITRPAASTIWIGRGWSPNAVEHATGRALDIIVSRRVGILPTPAEKAAGEAVVAWLIRHADALHIRHIIWDGRIWKRRYRHTPTAWTRHKSRPDISEQHRDHIHVYCDDANGTVPTAPLTLTTHPGEENMPLNQADLNNIASAINNNVWGTTFGSRGTFATMFKEVANDVETNRARTEELHTQVTSLAAAVTSLGAAVAALTAKLEATE